MCIRIQVHSTVGNMCDYGTCALHTTNKTSGSEECGKPQQERKIVDKIIFQSCPQNKNSITRTKQLIGIMVNDSTKNSSITFSSSLMRSFSLNLSLRRTIYSSNSSLAYVSLPKSLFQIYSEQNHSMPRGKIANIKQVSPHSSFRQEFL